MRIFDTRDYRLATINYRVPNVHVNRKFGRNNIITSRINYNALFSRLRVIERDFRTPVVTAHCREVKTFSKINLRRHSVLIRF